jgi:hypothetical protein
MLERILQPGVTVGDVARVLTVRSIDVARWRRGQPIPSYRREDLEGRIGRLVVTLDAETNERILELAPAPRGPAL